MLASSPSRVTRASLRLRVEQDPLPVHLHVVVGGEADVAQGGSELLRASPHREVARHRQGRVAPALDGDAAPAPKLEPLRVDAQGAARQEREGAALDAEAQASGRDAHGQRHRAAAIEDADGVVRATLLDLEPVSSRQRQAGGRRPTPLLRWRSRHGERAQ